MNVDHRGQRMLMQNNPALYRNMMQGGLTNGAMDPSSLKRQAVMNRNPYVFAYIVQHPH